MNECNNCAGGLHHLCAGNCFCGCPRSHEEDNIHLERKRVRELKDKLLDIEMEVNIAFQTHERTLKEETQKWFNTLLKIRGLCRL